MTNIAKLVPPQVTGAAATAADYLGPAVVTAVRGAVVVVDLPSGEAADVELAFAFPYSPKPRDVLLVIGREHKHYAIGVLHGEGRTTLRFSGDVSIVADGGKLELTGERGVDVTGPELNIQVRTLRTIAGAVTEKLGSLVQRVQGLWSVQAKDMHAIVEEGAVTHAKTATIVAADTATINGKQVHLG
ncbi:MAG: DUF3540 domain-containing protein [Polyangiaceae bacterium]|nr:DUF3540 domain-containing protein [Polyangiaceae bacterium]